LDEPCRLVAHAGGEGEGRVLDIGGGHPAELREAAGVEIDALEGAAHGRAAAPAVVAAEAGHVMGHDHALADAESRDGGAHRDHLAHTSWPKTAGARVSGLRIFRMSEPQ